jgi:hypothetical protein
MDITLSKSFKLAQALFIHKQIDSCYQNDILLKSLKLARKQLQSSLHRLLLTMIAIFVFDLQLERIQTPL